MKYIDCSGCRDGWCKGDGWECVPDSSLMEHTNMVEDTNAQKALEQFFKSSAGFSDFDSRVELLSPDGAYRAYKIYLEERKDAVAEDTVTKEMLEKFLASKAFKEGVIAATKAGWSGSGYSVELFLDGTWRVLWDNQIGNKYDSPGEIMSLPKLDDDDYHECLAAGMTEEEYFDIAFGNQVGELKKDMRDRWVEGEVLRAMWKENQK